MIEKLRTAPIANKVAHPITTHGDERIDPYFWMRLSDEQKKKEGQEKDEQSNDVITYLEEENAYTWWSNRGQAWLKNVGWRLDYQISNYENAIKAKKAYVYKSKRFSDHAPLIVEYK